MMIDVQKLVAHLRARLEKRVVDLAVISSTGYSFEGWIKWEAFCEWNNNQKPPRLRTEVPFPIDTKVPPRCDIVLPPVTNGSKDDVWIELAVVHDWTSGKWTSKIEDDVRTIQRARVGGAVVVVCTAEKRGAYTTQEGWERGWAGFFSDLRAALPGSLDIPEGWPDPAVEGMQLRVFAIVPD